MARATAPTSALRPRGSRSAQRLVAAFRRDGSPRAAGLIVTLYGDAVAPRGGRAWLGSIARLLAPLGVSERLVRTSVYRLVQAGWLRGEARGRRTDYCLSAEAAEECAHAEARIYARTAPAWDGRLHAALPLPGSHPRTREAMRKSLAWLGFGELPGPLWVHPSQDASADPRLVALSSSRLSPGQARALAAAAWPLQAHAQAWATFLRRHEPLLSGAAQATPEEAFLARLLMIHEYRRLLLRDPALPAELLPGGWKGEAARDLVAKTYAALWPGSEAHLRDTLVCADGRHPGLPARGLRRFAPS